MLLIIVRNDGEGRSKNLNGSLYLSDFISKLERFRDYHFFGFRDEFRCFLQPFDCVDVEGTIFLFLLLIFCVLFHLTERHLIPSHKIFLLADGFPDLLLHLKGLLDFRVLPVHEASVGPLELSELLFIGAV